MPMELYAIILASILKNNNLACELFLSLISQNFYIFEFLIDEV